MAKSEELREAIGRVVGKMLHDDPEVLQELLDNGGVWAVRSWIKNIVEPLDDEDVARVILRHIDWKAVYAAAERVAVR